jgi:hypothetical protein
MQTPHREHLFVVCRTRAMRNQTQPEIEVLPAPQCNVEAANRHNDGAAGDHRRCQHVARLRQ